MSLLFSTLLSLSLTDAAIRNCNSQHPLQTSISNTYLIADTSECGAKGCTRIGTTVAPAKPKDCKIEIYPSESDIPRPFEKLCLLNSSTGSTLLSNKSPAAAIRRMKKAACQCGADAVIVSDVKRESANWASWGKSRAQGIAIRYIAAPTASSHSNDSNLSNSTLGNDKTGETSASQVSAVTKTSTPTVASESVNPYQIAKQTTVILDGQNPGSGVIIGQSQNTYYVLTAKHVVATDDDYEVITPDGKQHSVEMSRIRRLPRLDLAIVEFRSSQRYKVAQVGDSGQVQQGENIFISGWPMPEEAITQPTHLVTKGEIVGIQPNEAEGYVFLYSNNTAPGMSGGSILDSQGQIVGIHGRAAGNQISGKVGINLGIPIQLFLDAANRANINLQQLGISAQN